MRKEIFENGSFCHVYNRGVDRRQTYIDDKDRKRFLRNVEGANRNHLVKILCFTLMPNHYHLLLKQEASHGISKFMQKLGSGYAQYFNKKYDRSGRLWESEFKATVIENEAQLLHISRYIHLNPLQLFFPQWKTQGVSDWASVQATLLSYPWSSYRNFLGIERSKIIDIDILSDMFRDCTDYENFIREWLVPGPRA